MRFPFLLIVACMLLTDSLHAKTVQLTLKDTCCYSFENLYNPPRIVLEKHFFYYDTVIITDNFDCVVFEHYKMSAPLSYQEYQYGVNGYPVCQTLYYLNHIDSSNYQFYSALVDAVDSITVYNIRHIVYSVKIPPMEIFCSPVYKRHPDFYQPLFSVFVDLNSDKKTVEFYPMIIINTKLYGDDIYVMVAIPGSQTVPPDF